jgi:hypothetical protein
MIEHIIWAKDFYGDVKVASAKPCSMAEFNAKWQKEGSNVHYAKRVMIKPKPPRYDDVYFAGVSWLDKQ